MNKRASKKQNGSIELIVLGLLAALIVVLAIPLLSGIGSHTKDALNNMNNAMGNATN